MQSGISGATASFFDRRKYMKRNTLHLLCCAALASFAASAQAVTTFEQNVSTAIDRGIEWLANQGYYNNPVAIDSQGGQPGAVGGIVLLAILEKRPSGDPADPPQGYDGATPTDQQRMRNLAAFLIDESNESLGSDETYVAGNYLMGLSRYLLTGGPGPTDGSNGMPAQSADYPTLLDAIKNLVNTLLANTDASGYFLYSTPPGASLSNRDSSATQLGIAGLAAAKSVFSNPAYAAGNEALLASINTALTNAKNSYEAYGAAAPNNGNTGSDNASCGVIDSFERGHGYRATTSYRPSLQQTASGTWIQILGGSTVNDTGVQQYLRWLRNHYRWQDLDSMGNSWASSSYWYYLWSSFKAFEFIEDSGVVLAPGNIGPGDMGLLGTAAGVDPKTGAYAACTVRQLRRDPAAVSQPTAFGGAPAPVYAGEEPGVYFDYASKIISHQCYDGATPINGTDGYFNCNTAPGDWNNYGKQAYALLVLQRATGACNDTDGDGICDDVDNCKNTPNANQADADGDGVGDACDNCKNTPNPKQEDQNQNGIGDACEIGKCDVDKDGDIDKTDLSMISKARGKTVPPFDQAYDATGEGKIDPADVKACIPKCTRPNCATQ
jgi:hypothetical protein